MIPRTIHVVWVGDDSKRPDNCITTWRDRNPSWQLRLWSNHDLACHPWRNKRHMDALRTREWAGVADLMRYEILLAHGGFAVDADAVCVRPLEDWLFDGAAGCASWENERAAPGLIAVGYLAAEPGEPVFRSLVDELASSRSVTHADAWIAVGPRRFTDAYLRARARHPYWRLWPSHHFIPEHHTGLRYSGSEPIFAEQKWGSTRRLYDTLHRTKV